MSTVTIGVHYMSTYKFNTYLTTRNGIYYFQKRVPQDVRSHYHSHSIACSLRTRSHSSAQKAAMLLVSQLEDYWMSLRIGQLADLHCSKMKTYPVPSSSGVNFVDAKNLYLKLKVHGKPDTFLTATERNAHYLIEAVGNKDLGGYKPSDGGLFRDWLINKGLASSSVKRVFSTVRAIMNLAISEHGLDIRSPFNSVYFPELDDVNERHPVPLNDLRAVQKLCKQYDDEMRWLLAIISDTGLRLAEAAGLLVDDICLESDTPHINLKPNSCRRLKTKHSARSVPLVGVALWAAYQLKAQSESGYAFPRYIKEGKCNSNSASAGLNKWVKEVASLSFTVHSFRHSMRDRLRAIQCPADIVDAIGGWTAGSIGEKYGNGYELDVLHEWMTKMALAR
jgi:integrase